MKFSIGSFSTCFHEIDRFPTYHFAPIKFHSHALPLSYLYLFEQIQQIGFRKKVYPFLLLIVKGVQAEIK